LKDLQWVEVKVYNTTESKLCYCGIVFYYDINDKYGYLNIEKRESIIFTADASTLFRWKTTGVGNIKVELVY